MTDGALTNTQSSRTHGTRILKLSNLKSFVEMYQQIGMLDLKIIVRISISAPRTE